MRAYLGVKSAFPCDVPTRIEARELALYVVDDGVVNLVLFQYLRRLVAGHIRCGGVQGCAHHIPHGGRKRGLSQEQPVDVLLERQKQTKRLREEGIYILL